MTIDLQPGRPVREHRWSAKTFAGAFWAGLGLLIFAGWFVVTRLGVSHAMRIWDIVAFRFGIGAVVLAPVLFYSRSHLPSGAWRSGFLFSLLWGAPFVLCVALGLELTSARLAASITPAMMPVFAGLIGLVFLREKLGRTRLIGYMVIIVGVTSLVVADVLTRGLPNPEGLGALALAAAMWASYTLLFRKSGLTALQAAAMICVWSAAIYLPVYMWLGLSRIGLATPGEIALQIGYQGILISGVAIAVFNRALSLLGPAATAAVIALIPAAAALLAIPVLGEVPSLVDGTAIAVLAAGVLLSARPV